MLMMTATVLAQDPKCLSSCTGQHKAQGLTLDKVIIHSSYEFTGGLLYTALSRVKSIDDVQVLRFRREHASKRDNELNAISELPQRDLKNCPCSRDVNWQAIEDVQALEPHEVSDEDLLKIVQDMFDETGAADQFIGVHDNEETEGELSMEEVLEMVEENGHILAKPPDDFDVSVSNVIKESNIHR